MTPSTIEHRSKTLEDVLLKFIEKHNRGIWVTIGLIAVVVALAVDRG
jgi:hypothetical protein